MVLPCHNEIKYQILCFFPSQNWQNFNDHFIQGQWVNFKSKCNFKLFSELFIYLFILSFFVILILFMAITSEQYI